MKGDRVADSLTGMESMTGRYIGAVQSTHRERHREAERDRKKDRGRQTYR